MGFAHSSPIFCYSYYAMNISNILSVLNSGVKDRIFPGAALSVSIDGFSAHKIAVGNFTYDEKSPIVSVSTIFDIASVTKTIVATAALKLLDLGKINLESAIGEYLLQIANTDVGKRITVWNLLTHTSSINVRMSHLAGDAISRGAFFKVLAEYNTKLEPGAEVNYANANTFLLGEIITAVSGVPLDVFIKREVTEPLQMVDTNYVPSPDIIERIAPTEIEDGVTIQGIVHDPSARGIGGIAGHAGIFSTISDLNNFLTMWTEDGVFNGKKVLAKDTVDLALTNQTPSLNKSSGLGWHLDNPDYLGHLMPSRTFFHPGFTGTIIAGNISRKCKVAFLSNCTFPHRENHHIKNEFLKKLFDAVFS